MCVIQRGEEKAPINGAGYQRSDGVVILSNPRIGLALHIVQCQKFVKVLTDLAKRIHKIHLGLFYKLPGEKVFNDRRRIIFSWGGWD